jgi:uncharacterized membrane protein
MTNRARWALLTTATVTAAGVGGLLARRRRRRQPDRQDGWYVVHRGITVDRPVPAVIGFWSDRERLDRALGEWATLRRVDGNRWRCEARDPRGGESEWTAEITVDAPGRLRWRVTDGPMAQEGTVELTPAPADRGTEIRADLRYRSSAAGRLRGLVRGAEPDLLLRSALRRVKSLVECGQVVDTHRDPSGRTQAQEKATDKVRDTLQAGGRP